MADLTDSGNFIKGSIEVIKDLKAEVEQLKLENERLNRWKSLILTSPEGAKNTVLERFVLTEQIQPVIKHWKDKVAELEQKNDNLMKIADQWRSKYFLANEKIESLSENLPKPKTTKS